MASRKRVRPGRLLLVLGLALLLWLLLELNRFLPGAWPGGAGSGGSRPRPAGLTSDPTRVEPSPTPPPAPAAPTGLVVTVLAPSGEPSRGGEVELGFGGDAVRVPLEEDGSATFSRVPAGGAFVPVASVRGRLQLVDVVRDGRRLVHGAPPAASGSDLRVVWPRASVPLVRGGGRPTSREVRVVDEQGRPVAAAEVAWSAGGREGRTTTDASGRATLAGWAAPVARLCVSAAGTGETCAYASVEAEGPLELRVPTLTRVSTTFTAAESGAALAPTTLRLVAPDGTTSSVTRPEGGFAGFERDLPYDFVAGGALEVVAEGRAPLFVPLKDLAKTTAVPPGRAVEVTVTGPDGAPRAGARVTAAFPRGGDAEAATGSPLEEAGTTGQDGRVTLHVPLDRPVTLVADAGAAAPAGATVAPGREAAAVALAVGPSHTLEVRVVDAAGAAAGPAHVVALVRAGTATVRRTATADAAGVARLAGLPPGRAEVFAHAAGRAWAVAVAEVPDTGPATVTLSLQRGLRLLLVVEDPDGVPLPGVAVRSAARSASSELQGPAPADPDEAPWVTDAHGVLSVDDLADRELDLYLHAGGFSDEVVARVRPGPATWFATMVPVAPR